MSNQKGPYLHKNRCKWRKKKNRQKKESDLFGDHCGNESSGHKTSDPDIGQGSSDSNPDIPGFYFDKEKKRYFRILPGQNNPCDSSFVTRESVQKRNSEDTRQKDLKLLVSPIIPQKHLKINTNPIQFSPCSSLTTLKKKLWRSTNVTDFISSIPFGVVSTVHCKSRMRHIITENLKPLAHSKVFDSPVNSYEKLEHMHQMLSSTVNPSNLICLWSLKHLLVQRIQTLNVKSVLQTQEQNHKLSVTVTGAMIPKAVSKITSMCCAPVCTRGNTEEYVLYTTMCLIGNNPSLVMLRNLNCTDASDFRLSEFSLSFKATWCSAWNRKKQCFAVGTEKCALLVDVQTRSMWKLHSENSDVLSQDFTQCGSMLYSGTRRGVILGHDLRSKSTHHSIMLSHTAGICSLKALCHQEYLLASDFNDQITKWDLRQNKVITAYEGHRNQHSIIPLHVNEELDVVYSAGQDCYSRIWNLRSGELMKSIPPPHPASITTIPTLHYSDYIGGRPGLLMGMLDEVHFYSL